MLWVHKDGCGGNCRDKETGVRRNIIGMVQISPKIIQAVITLDYPPSLTLVTLKKLSDLWSGQEAMLLEEK